MADYDSNLIKPVQGLQNIGGLAPAKRRKERKRRRQAPEESAEYDGSANEEETAQQKQIENTEEQDNGRIDYCA